MFWLAKLATVELYLQLYSCMQRMFQDHILGLARSIVLLKLCEMFIVFTVSPVKKGQTEAQGYKLRDRYTGYHSGTQQY